MGGCCTQEVELTGGGCAQKVDCWGVLGGSLRAALAAFTLARAFTCRQ